MSSHHSVIIIGAGLSGLYTAWNLRQQNIDVRVLEARNRIGGRILSPEIDNINGTTGQVDMGPAWVWPMLQPRMAQLLDKLQLSMFSQFVEGEKIYQYSATQVERYNDQSPHSQSWRIQGGSYALITALQSQLPEGCIQLGTRVTKIHQDGLCIDTIIDEEQVKYTADQIILALPPRLWVQDIVFAPEFSATIAESWRSLPTWMAAQAKLVFTYSYAFWKDKNLSGEAFSRYGPLSEIADASTFDNKLAALSAFVGLNAQQRRQMNEQQLIDASLKQLAQFFGDECLTPLDIQFKDWSHDKYTCSEVDINTVSHHPAYAADMPRHFWDKKLILAGSEIAVEHGGYLEGALESAGAALKILNDTMPLLDNKV